MNEQATGSVPRARLLSPHADLRCRAVESPESVLLLPRRQMTLASSLVLGTAISTIVFCLLLSWQHGNFWNNLADLLSDKLFATMDRDLALDAGIGVACGVLVVLAGLAMDVYQKRRGLFLEASVPDRMLRLPRRRFEAPFSDIKAVELTEVHAAERLSDGRQETFLRDIQVNIVHDAAGNEARVNLITLRHEAAEEDGLRDVLGKISRMIGSRMVEDIVILPEAEYQAWKRSRSDTDNC